MQTFIIFSRSNNAGVYCKIMCTFESFTFWTNHSRFQITNINMYDLGKVSLKKEDKKNGFRLFHDLH